MLCVTRKKNESLHIGNNIQVTILEVKGDRVRVGVAAPRDIPVHRGEVFTQIKRDGIMKIPDLIPEGVP